MSTEEHVIQQRIRAAISSEARCWRNNVGQLLNEKGIPVRYGLAVGSSDLVGLVRPSGRMFCLEIKTAAGKASPEQLAWLETIRRFGGVAGICRSVDDAIAIVELAKQEDLARAISIVRALAPELLR